jgi:hypothetical protein
MYIISKSLFYFIFHWGKEIPASLPKPIYWGAKREEEKERVEA